MFKNPSTAQPNRLRVNLLSLLLSAVVSTVVLSGCNDDHTSAAANATEAGDGHGHDHNHSSESGDALHDGHAPEEVQGITAGSIPIPPQVRQNLGITFARVEMRRVVSTIRLPGRFEIHPGAVRQYHAPMTGRVELLVNQYDQVTTGMPLYRLDSGEWRRMQQEYLALQAEILETSAALMTAQVAREGGEAASEIIDLRVAASDAHIRTLTESIQVGEERERQIARLQELVGGRLTELNEARSQLATLRNELSQAREDRAELEHEHLQLSTAGTDSAYGTTETRQASLLARQAEYESAKARRDLLKASLSSIMGETGTSAAVTIVNWKITPDITIRAATEGLVSQVSATSGAYVDGSSQILTTINPQWLRFRAVALQSDIAKLNTKMSGRVLPPATAVTSMDETIPVSVTMALEADHEERTLDLVADVNTDKPWARPGVSTVLELVLDDTEDPEPAIPVAAIIQDGLDKVFFRRNPAKPDEAMRVIADSGMSDGKWVEVYSGVKAGDEVVLNGVYELKLATADQPTKGGHVHADGTFHEEH